MRGTVDRRDDGVFLLKGPPPDQLEPPARRRRQARRAWPQTAPAIARHSALVVPTPEFERLRARVGELGERHNVAVERVANELERARLARAHSAALRARAQADRRRVLAGDRLVSGVPGTFAAAICGGRLMLRSLPGRLRR